MAQFALSNCDICARAPGTEFCLECEQYFCDSCKSLHKRQKATKGHNFQSGSNVIKEVKSKCKEHNEDFIYLCTTCDVSACRRCVAGKHRGHEMSNIDDSIQELKEAARKEINSRRDMAKKNLLKMEEGLGKFDSEVTTVIQAIREDGTRIKAMVDKEVEKMITAVKDKAKQEKEKLSNFMSSARGLFDETNALEKRREQLRQDREDVILIQKLKAIKNDISRLRISSVPVFPIVGYSSKSMQDKEIANLLGSFTLCATKATQSPGIEASETNATEVRNSSTKKSLDVQEEEKQKGYLYRCSFCGQKEVKKTRAFGPLCRYCLYVSRYTDKFT